MRLRSTVTLSLLILAAMLSGTCIGALFEVTQEHFPYLVAATSAILVLSIAIYLFPPKQAG